MYGPAVSLTFAPLPKSNDVLPQNSRVLVFGKRAFEGTPPDANGMTLGDRMYIFTEPIQQSNDPHTALTYAVAHELGHSLGLQHSATGIMSPNLNDRTISQELFLTPHEIRKLQRYTQRNEKGHD